MLIAIVRGISGLFSALPLSAARAVGRRLGWIYGYVVRYHRRDATEALRRSLPETTEAERRQILKRMYLNLGMNLVEELRMGRMTDEELYDYVVWDGEAHIREVLGFYQECLSGKPTDPPRPGDPRVQLAMAVLNFGGANILPGLKRRCAEIVSAALFMRPAVEEEGNSYS